MLFYSFLFVLIFLPVTVIGWHFLGAFRNRAVSEWFMILASIVFYSLFGVRDLLVLVGCTAAGYIFHRLIWNARSARATRVILILSVLFFVGVLSFYKIAKVSIPVGLSFYIFWIIAFLAARAKGELADVGIREYLLCTLYFPKLAQGPITLPDEMFSSFRNRTRGRIDRDKLVRGLMLFIFGLAKKVLIADTLASPVRFGFENAALLDTGTILLVLMSYAFQLYFDFSGYCDMGMGVSWMLGIDLPVNFDMPFKSKSLGEFWNRWHATLSRFFTKYVYIPLGGSRKGSTRTVVNIFAVFILSGLWHGIGLTYLVWGLFNGAFVALSHFAVKRTAKTADVEGAGKKRSDLPARLRIFAAFLFTLIFFGSKDIGSAFIMLRRLVLPLWPGFLLRTAASIQPVEFYPVLKALSIYLPGTENTVLLVLWVLILILCIFLSTRDNARDIAAKMPLTSGRAIAMALLFVWTMLAFNNVASFLYFAY